MQDLILRLLSVAFKIYNMDKDGYISNGELCQVLKMMVGNNITTGRIFLTDTPERTVQTQIRLLLEEQSDLGLHCLPFHLHFWGHFAIRVITALFLVSKN